MVSLVLPQILPPIGNRHDLESGDVFSPYFGGPLPMSISFLGSQGELPEETLE